jgi:hypothetical protein
LHVKTHIYDKHCCYKFCTILILRTLNTSPLSFVMRHIDYSRYLLPNLLNKMMKIIAKYVVRRWCLDVIKCVNNHFLDSESVGHLHLLLLNDKCQVIDMQINLYTFIETSFTITIPFKRKVKRFKSFNFLNLIFSEKYTISITY